MEINTHGIKIDLETLRSVSKWTEDVSEEIRQDIFIDRADGTVHCWCGMKENWCEWRDESIIQVASTRRHRTAQWIADRVEEALLQDRHQCEYCGEEYPYAALWA